MAVKGACPLQWMALQLLLGPYVRVDDTWPWIGWVKHMPWALTWTSLGLIHVPKAHKSRPSQGKEGRCMAVKGACPPQWMALQLLLGPYVRVDDTWPWIGWVKHMPW